jgi:hypothetical protein
MICTMCDKEANRIFQGESMCPKHFEDAIRVMVFLRKQQNPKKNEQKN